ncbi:MAG: LamG-like jellyroll fold domain-containing protein [Paludibacter sp.]
MKNHSDFKKFYFLILLIVFFISPRLYADTAFDTSNSTHLSISLGSGVDAYNYIDFKVMVLETAGTDDGMRYCDFYIVEDDNTETKILHMDNANLVHDGLPLDAFTPTNSATNGFIASGLPTYTTSGTITQANFKWYYPQRLISKSIKIKMKYIWDLDLDGKGDTEKYKDITISLPTPPLSNLGLSVKPISDKKFRLSWSNSTNISKLIITYNGIVDSTIVAANSTMVDFTALNVKIDAAFTFKVIPVYIPQNPPGDTYTKRYQGESVDVSSLGIQFVNTIYPSYNVGGQFVDLSWTVGNSSGNTSSYYAKRGSTVLTPNVPFNSREIKDYGDGGTLKNWSSYTYTIYTVPSGGTIADSLTGFKKTVTVYTSPNKPRFEDFKLESYPTIGSIKPYVKASWSADWVGINTVKLYHRVSTDKNFTLLGIIPSHYGTISYEDKNNIIDNSTQIYKLEVNVFDSIFSKIDSVEVVNKVKLKKFKASKNTVSDRIQLSWEIDNLDLCDKFEIYRSFTTDSLGKDVQSTPEIINQLSAQSIYNTWDDHTAAPGILYFYKIIAYKTGLDGKTRTTISTDLGYRMPTGTITGRITYGGGTAVKGVSLYINSSSVDNNILNKSLHFTNNENQLAQIGLTKAQHGCINTGFSFQSWIKMTNTPNNYTPIIEVNKEYSIGLREGYIQIFIGENLDLTKPTTKCKLDSSIINDSSYFHLSVTLDRKTDSLKVYINGIPKKDAFVKINNNTICSFVDEVLSSSTGEIISSRTKSYLGRSTDDQWLEGKDFNGNIDDVRLWSNSIDANSIASNYNHYLNGNEDGLIGYWPMDEGNNSYAFDYSKSNGRFNEHHIILNSIYTSKIIPKTEQLAIKGVTDGDGNYIIHGIPYSGDGSTYSIKPVFGTHTFNPTQQSCYISPTSLVHDGQNFEDKSSFPVKVKVKYSNTKYPVPGVMLYVDENPCSVENKLITTASQLTYDNTRTGEFKTIDAGECVIDVPIGEHYIRAELSNHTFENSGRWPAIGKQEFSENSVNTIEFADTTLVTVVGRVVGGTIENSYPIGFKNSDKKKNHSSHANIGKAQLIMQPTFYKDYSLNYSSADKIQTLTATEASKFGSVAKYKANSSIVEITTDATTGEYMIKLPPIKWDINSVKTSTSSLYSNDMSIISDIQSFNTSKLITATDTATNVETNKVDSFTYNVKKSFVYQAPTVIEVRDAVTQSIAFGESEWHVTSPGLAEEVRSLYTIAGTTPSSVKYLYGVNPTYYPNGKPVFAQGKEYALNIYAYESYKHPEGLDTTTMKQFAKVPLKGATLNIKNEIGVTFKKLVPDASDTIVSNVMKLDSIGKRNYIFKAGFPNLADVNSGLGLTISIQNGSSAPVYWREMGDFRAIVTGCEPIAGTNFVTKGPVLPLVILRDPPGSNSYAYMETGTTLSYSFVNKSVFNGNFSATSTIKIGPKLTTAIGFGFMALTEMENQNSLKIGSEGEYSDFSGSTGTKTIKTTERIQTSASPDFVGSNADVYIGTSTNVYYCQSRDLNIQKTGLAVDTVSTASISGDTEFRFSQNEITTAQIPKWKQMLKQMLITVPEANFNAAKSNYQTQANTNKVNYYLTTLSQSDENFGMDTKTYTIIRPSNLNLTDTIETIANTIRGWQNIIYNNEEQKKTASTNSNYVKENISFDAGTSIVRSYTYTDNKGTTSGGTDKTQAVLGTTFGFAINSIGMQVDAQTKLGGGSESSTNSSKENTTTCGYVLSDPDADNRFAVNVYKNKLLDKSESDLPNTDAYADKSLSSYIFELVGGQSSCPYESADSTLFYKENNKTVKLANGTTPLDAPYINITSYTKTDIPNGKDASFILELGNNSIIQSPRAYMLYQMYL